MKAKSSTIVPRDPMARVALGTAAILAIPLIMMQFSDEWQWDPFDFIVVGTLLFGRGTLYVLLAGMVQKREYRIALGFLLAALCAFIWAEMAVGIFTNLGS